MELFKINDLQFSSEDFLDDISEFEDIIPIIQELQNDLSYEEINCVGKNECCGNTDKNFIVEIHGFIDDNDEFITKDELIKQGEIMSDKKLDIFIIRLYKCVDCGKWIIDILE